jgi:hypothetical protein
MFEKAIATAEEYGVSIADNMTSGAAQGFANLLQNIIPDANNTKAQEFSNALNNLIDDKTPE